eukprot:11865523-Alexandrium_andersonii.AAC.1
MNATYKHTPRTHIQAHTTPSCNMPQAPGPHPPLAAHNHARSPRTQTQNTGATQESPRDIKN